MGQIQVYIGWKSFNYFSVDQIRNVGQRGPLATCFLFIALNSTRWILNFSMAYSLSFKQAKITFHIFSSVSFGFNFFQEASRESSLVILWVWRGSFVNDTKLWLLASENMKNWICTLQVEFFSFMLIDVTNYNWY